MPLWRWFQSLLIRLGLIPERLIPTEPISFRAIGVVRNGVQEPRMEGWETIPSDLIFKRELTDALDGIEGYSHVIVLFQLHHVSDQERARTKCHPRGDPRYPLMGVLATRTQHRPNPIGVSVVPLLRRRRNVLRVRGLDAINGTPILDLKPYIPRYDETEEVRVPDWITQPLPPEPSSPSPR